MLLEGEHLEPLSRGVSVIVSGNHRFNTDTILLAEFSAPPFFTDLYLLWRHEFMRNYILKTERIGFSEWTDDDMNLARSLWGDKSVTKYICATGEFTEQDISNRLKTEIDNNKRFGVQYWPIFDLKTENFIGCCGLRPYDLNNSVYEIGFHLKSEYWGKGLAPEAAKATIKYAFDVLNTNNLFAGHNPNNVNSKKVLERLGFHYEKDEYYAPTGLYHPSYKYR